MLLAYIISFSLLGSIVALVGAGFLFWKEGWMRRNLLHFVIFAAGGLIAATFLDLIPEAFEKSEPQNVILWVLFGFLTFFIIERLIFWYHCHNENCVIHTIGNLVFFTGSMHNFFGGAVIALSFIISIPLGVTTAIVIFLHELPQAFVSAKILIHRSWSRGRAALFNILSSLLNLVGALGMYYFSTLLTPGVLGRLLALAAGGFIYIASSDLFAENHKDFTRRSGTVQIMLFVSGLLIIGFIARLVE